MTDERLFDRLATHSGAADIDPGFDERLYALLQQEIRRPKRSAQPALLLVAVLVLALALGGAVLVGSGLVKLPTPPVLPYLPDASAAPDQSQATPIPLLVGCNAAVSWCQNIPAGTYVTTVGWGPLPGLVVTLPAGWSSTDPRAGELNFQRVADPNQNDRLNFWRDVMAVDQTGQPATGIGTTPRDLADFLATDPRLIVSDRGPVTIGNGIPAITLVMRVNPAGPNDDPQGCPGESCANVLRAPVWDVAYGITVNALEDPSLACPCSNAVRLYLVAIGPASDPGTFVLAVEVYAPDPDSELARFQAAAQPIIDSIRLPAETEVLQP